MTTGMKIDSGVVTLEDGPVVVKKMVRSLSVMDKVQNVSLLPTRSEGFADPAGFSNGSFHV